MINKKLALFFHNDFLKAAICPLPNQLEILNEGSYHLYFQKSQGKYAFGPFKEDYFSGSKQVIGDYYNFILSGRTIEIMGYESYPIELLDPILEDIKVEYKKALQYFTQNSEESSFNIPTKICFVDNIKATSQNMIINFLGQKGFAVDRNSISSPSENLIRQKLKSFALPPNGVYGLIEALNDDMVISLLQVNKEKVNRKAFESFESYGSDPRIGVISKIAVDRANEALRMLSKDVLSAEYKKQTYNAVLWNTQLINTKKSFQLIQVELSANPGYKVPVTLIKKDVEELTRTRSRQIIILFERFLENYQLGTPDKILFLGDSLLNDQVVDHFYKFGKGNIHLLGSNQISDILLGMLTSKVEAEPVTSESPIVKDFIQSTDLKPGDQIELKWGMPVRELTLSYEGNSTFFVVQAKNAKIIVGDRFKSKQFEKGKRARMESVYRTTEGKLLGRYESGALQSVNHKNK